MRDVVAVSRERPALTGRGCGEISSDYTQPVAQDAVVQQRWSLIEQQDVHSITTQRGREVGRQFRRVAKGRAPCAVGIDVHGDVNVAVRLRASVRSGAEQVGIQDLGSGPETLF